jgi:hypothetical protein
MNPLVPNSDLSEYLQLPADVRQEVDAWLAELAAVARPIQRSLAAVAARMGVSLPTARRKYDLWRPARNWKALVNRAKVPPERGLPDDFTDWWKKLCEQNGRKCKPAYREFCRRWKAGEPIPGLDNTLPRYELPPGTSYDNLIRFRPTKFELTAARIGRSAAADRRPLVFTTRVGLAVGQYLVFDDMWHDFKVVAVGQRRAMRLLQLHAHDLFSGCQFARGIKPRLEDEATGKSVGLKEDEMLFLLAHVLDTYGYRGEGCTLLVEHGTAAVREDIERALFDLTKGKIVVNRSGIEGAAAFAGQYAGRSKGNFRLKATLESLGNLIHNETANLIQFPGQTGSNSRVNLPEELHGRERHTDALLKALLALPADRAAQLRMPFLEVSQARWLVESIMDRINDRQDHELEGWEEAGLTTVDYSVPGIGIMSGAAVLALPPERQAVILAGAQPVARKLSPKEVFENGRRGLLKFQPAQTAALLHTRAGREVKVGEDRLIEFEDQTISPSPLVYEARTFAPGEKFEIVVNPFAPQTAHLFDVRGAWRGVVNAWGKIRRDDVAGLHRRMGEAAKIERQLLQPLAARGAELTRQRIEDAQHNAEVLGGDAKRQARNLRQFDGDAGEFLDQPEPGRTENLPTGTADDFSAEGLL